MILLDSIDVVGVSFMEGYPENLHRLRMLDDERTGPEPLVALLVRDYENDDPNAVAVHVPAVGKVGFVPRDRNEPIAVLLDGGRPIAASVALVRIHPDHPDRPGITVSAALIPKESTR